MSAQLSVKRPIRTSYYEGKNLMKITVALHPERAVERAVGHLRHDDYKAHVVEIFDTVTGVLHAVLKKESLNRVEFLYKRGVQE